MRVILNFKKSLRQAETNFTPTLLVQWFGNWHTRLVIMISRVNLPEKIRGMRLGVT